MNHKESGLPENDSRPLPPVPLRNTWPGAYTGWDFSTGEVKCLAFDLNGNVLAEVRLPTDLWRGEQPESGISELNLLQLEGQARASVRGIVGALRRLGRLQDWVAGGISATHHTAGRIDENHLPIRRAICWNDQTLAAYRAAGEKRLGGPAVVKQLIGGPWADRYTLSHLVKDEDAEVSKEEERYLKPADWRRTYRILLHGPLAAGYLTGHFDVTSVSSAASTGIMSFVTRQWSREMLGALKNEEYRQLAWQQLPRIIDHYEPIGPLAEHLALECQLDRVARPMIYPTSDDQQAGLVGGGAVDDGQMAIILGNSAVVNSSSAKLPQCGRSRYHVPELGPLSADALLQQRCWGAQPGGGGGEELAEEAIGSSWRSRPARCPPARTAIDACHFLMPNRRWASTTRRKASAGGLRAATSRRRGRAPSSAGCGAALRSKPWLP
jgi:xylulokinase